MIWCKHNWKMLSETTTQSTLEHTFEQARKHGRDINTVPAQLADGSRRLIQIVHCDKCGKLQRFVERI